MHVPKVSPTIFIVNFSCANILQILKILFFFQVKIWFQNHRYKLKKSRSSDEQYTVNTTIPNFIAMRGNFPPNDNFKNMMNAQNLSYQNNSYGAQDYSNYPNYFPSGYGYQQSSTSSYIPQNPQPLPAAVPSNISWTY